MAFNPVLNLGDLNGRNGFVIKGLDISLGWSVSNAGDVNADGLDDVILSGSGEQDYVIFGSSQDFGISFDVSEIDGSNGFVIEKRDDSFLSWSVSGAGDVNGDGIDDLIIGAPFAASGGESYVVFGRNQGFGSRVNISDLDGSNGFVIENRNNIDLSFGRSVSGAGDINGDGIDEIIIGSPGNSSLNNVGSYVVFGNDQGFNARLDVVFDLNDSNGFGIAGIDWNDDFGRSVSGVGDINGDGIDDIIIGASSASSNDDNLYAGQSYVIFGSSQGFDLRSEYFNPRIEVADLNGSNGFIINGVDEFDDSGFSVSGAGDVNGDGIDDIIISAIAANPNGEFRAGESYVVFGSDEGFSASLDLSNLNGNNGFVINGIDKFDVSGFSVSGAGDVNGDGFDDLIIGAPGADPNSKFFAGKSYVVLGSDHGSDSLNLSELDGSNGFVIQGIDEWDFSGFSVSGAGDINGDSIDDLIIGASGSLLGWYNGGSRETYVVFGMPQGNNTPTAVDDAFTTEKDVTTTFDVLRNDTDLNGDRITINSVTQPANGIVSVNLDNSLTYAPNSNFTGNDSFTYEISDGNGSTDTATVNLTIIAGEDPTSIEFNPVLNLSDLNGRNGFVLKGIDEGDFSGSSVSSAGDVNGDGFDDLIIGASWAESNADLSYNISPGESYVVFGGDQGFSANLNLSELDGRNGFTISGDVQDFSGYSVSRAGDINGDSIDDIIVSASWANSNNYGPAGKSYVIFGSNQVFSANLNLSELDGSNGFAINGIDPENYNSGGDLFGSSVSSAGDINGDGFDDLIIGAPRAEYDRYSYPNFDIGDSYVVFGSDQDFSSNLNLSRLNGNDAFVITGIDGRDFSGSSVSGAGDFNGDGFDDLIIGAPDADPNDNSYAGESYIVFGGNSFFDRDSLEYLNGNNGFVINGINEGDNSGVSVSGAGDVNGDGFDDVIIGAHRTDIDGNLSVGESYVVFGSDQDFNRNFDLADLNGNNGFAIKGVSAGDFAGRSVSAAGDINNDGFDDLIIGAQGADPNGNLSAGESYVVLGQAQGFGASLDLADLNGRNGFTIKGINPNDFSGRSVSGAGDINGDGTDDVIIGAPGGNDSAGESYVIFGINPDSVNNLPVAADDAFTIEENIAVTFDVLSNDSDPDSDRINISSIIQPDNGGIVTFSDDGQALIYTPSIDFNGTDTFTYTITDGLDTDTAAVTITIEPEASVNTAPNTVDDQSSTAFNTSVTVNVLNNDTDSENDLLSIESFEASSTNNGTITLSADSQALVYTPSIDFSGTDTFTYTVTDGTETDTATVTVTVNPDLDQPPIVANAIADFEVEEGSGNRVFDLSTLFADPDNDDVFITKTIVSNSNPNLVEAIINGDVFTLNFQAGETGSTEITIEGHSNGKTVTDTFTATITEIDEVDAPLEIVAPIPSLEVEQDSVNQVIDLSTIFTDPDNDDLAIAKEISDNTNPDLVQAVLEGNLLTLDFQPGQSGTSDITILATSNGETLTNTFTVTVNPIPEDQPPIVANSIADITVDQGSPETSINLADVFTDPDNDDLLITSSILSNSNSTLVTPTISGNILELVFNETESGSTNLVIEATSNNQTVTDEVTITVNAVTPTPINTPTPIDTPPPINSPTPTPTPVNIPTPTPVNTPTPTPIDTPTPINSPTPIDTLTPTPTPINSPTPTPNPINFPVNRVDSPTPTPNTPSYTPIDPTIFVPRIQDPNIAPNPNPAETINIVASSELTVGSDNADNIFGSNTSDIIFAQKGTDFVEGGNGNETIFGGQGNDLILGGFGNDSIFGNWGNDIVSGGDGNDWMNGNQEDDFLNGGESSDTVFGGKQNDTLQGEAGNDELFGNLGNDLLEGNEGDDFLYGGQQADTVSGNGGNDVVSGDLGSDLLDGNAGEDTVTGGEGDDTLDGGEGDDNLEGGEGDDQLVGAGGNDIVRGGGGSDQFVLVPGDGTDTIVDFEVGIDKIGLPEGLIFTNLTLTSESSEIRIAFGEETLATVLGISTLNEADFEIV